MTAVMTMSLLAGCSEKGGTETASQKTEATEESQAGGTEGEDLKTIRILGIDNTGTDDSGKTVYLSDWVNGNSKMWEKLTSDLAERGVALELDLIPADPVSYTHLDVYKRQVLFQPFASLCLVL